MLRARALGVLLAALGLGALFAWNGLGERWRQPETGRTTHAARPAPVDSLRVLAFNLAGGGARRGGWSFAAPADVRAELAALGDVLRREQVDVACLSEVVFECGPCPVNQVTWLAEQAGMHAWAFGENYDWGLPGYAIRAGNAVLSRLPLEGVEVVQLPGGRPFWSPTGNRRLLWTRLDVGGLAVALGAVRNDSFDLANNLVQVRELLAELPAGPVLLAGDFNAEPHDPSLRAFHDSGRFLAADDDSPTFPAGAPTRRIDHVLAPAGWRRVDERVLRIGASDHLAVLATFRLPARPR